MKWLWAPSWMKIRKLHTKVDWEIIVWLKLAGFSYWLLADWLTEWLTPYLTDQLNDCLTVWRTDWLTAAYLTGCHIEWLADWHSNCVTQSHCLTVWLSGSLIHGLSDHDSLTHWPTDSLTHWLTQTDSLTHRVTQTDSLTDTHIELWLNTWHCDWLIINW